MFALACSKLLLQLPERDLLSKLSLAAQAVSRAEELARSQGLNPEPPGPVHPTQCRPSVCPPLPPLSGIASLSCRGNEATALPRLSRLYRLQSRPYRGWS